MQCWQTFSAVRKLEFLGKLGPTCQDENENFDQVHSTPIKSNCPDPHSILEPGMDTVDQQNEMKFNEISLDAITPSNYF